MPLVTIVWFSVILIPDSSSSTVHTHTTCNAYEDLLIFIDCYSELFTFYDFVCY